MTIPNIISIFRIFLIPFIVYFLLFFGHPEGKIIAGFIFAFLSLSDLIDGILARALNQVSSLGKFLDPLADKFLVVVTAIALVELRIISSIPVIIIIMREFAVMGLRVHAGLKGINIPASFFAKFKTSSQMIAILFLLFGLPYGVEILWFAVALSLLSGIEYFWNLRGAFYG